ncbi:hypothetical protein IQ266_07680 [filamentous cyanobacterium LEGE 11480]|uniref:Uncharacterized protein n=1 Tax=Romeriopsis navalis LEGE 11480 TaxID=2777977 RepID=A0A928VJ69_9CYAN|nr:hypothetical protein [Romeriopsis navalis]MBE9029608.1 hypothetical protein [Romeriopsis navalis LEGE 11480]
MQESNLLILTIYFLCVTYVLFQIVNAFNDEYTISLDKEALEAELKRKKIDDRLEINFKFNNRYEINSDRNKLQDLSVSVKNKSTDYPIYIDWDYSSMDDWFGGRSRRLTRMVSGSLDNLSQQQVLSVINPGLTLQEKIVPEDTLARKGEGGEIQVSKPLLDLMPPPGKAPAPKKKMYKAFLNSEDSLSFNVNLVMRFVDQGSSTGGDRVLVQCKFNLHRLSWKAGLTWNPK